MDILKEKWKKQILEIIADSTEPVGSWFIVNELKERGVEVSSATIGRELNQLENMGLVEKQSFKGRLITQKGRDFIAEANSSIKLDFYKKSLDEFINSNVLENFLMVLEARQAIERETVRLAAERITDEEIEELTLRINAQQNHFDKDMSVAEDDIAFHSSIAKASKNKALFSLYMILSTMGQQSELFEQLRKRIGDSYTGFHQEILDALKKHNAEKAEASMLRHIDSLKEDVKQYWHDYKEK